MYHPLDAFLAFYGALVFIHAFFNFAWLAVSSASREETKGLLWSFGINLLGMAVLLALGFINSALPVVRFY